MTFPRLPVHSLEKKKKIFRKLEHVHIKASTLESNKSLTGTLNQKLVLCIIAV